MQSDLHHPVFHIILFDNVALITVPLYVQNTCQKQQNTT